MARNILVKILGDGADARAEIKYVLKDLDELGAKRAKATIRVDAAQAKREAAEVLAGLKALPHERTIAVQIRADTAKLAALEASMARLQTKTAEFAAAGKDTAALEQRMGRLATQIDGTGSHLRGLTRELDSLGIHGERALVRIDNVLKRGASSLAGFRTGLQGLLGALPLVGGLVERLAAGLAQMVISLLPEAASGFAQMVVQGIALAPVAAILVVIVALVASLVVALAQAVLGFAAVGFALVAALGPVGILLAAVALKIKGILEAQQQLKQATDAVKQAQISQASAAQALAQAQHNQAEQHLAALNDERAAILGLTDAENAYKDAQLGVASAKLQAEQARLSLAQMNRQITGFGMAPGSLQKRAAGVDVSGPAGQQQTGADPLGYKQLLLQYRQAVLAVKTADQGVADATAAAADSANGLALAHQKVDKYLRDGLKAYPGYLDALQQTAQATRGLAGADIALTGAERNRAKLLREYGKEGKGFIEAWTKFKKVLGEIFGPALHNVFAGIERALGVLGGDKGGIAKLREHFGKLGKAVGDAFVGIAKTLTDPKVVKGLVGLIDGATKLTKLGAPMMNNLFRVLLDVANAALPALLSVIKSLAEWLKSAAEHPKRTKQFIQDCIDKATTFLHVIENVIGFVGKLAGLWQTIKGLVGDFAYGITHLGDLFGPLGSVINFMVVEPIKLALGNVARLWGIMKELRQAQAQGAAMAKANAPVEQREIGAAVARGKGGGAARAKSIAELKGLIGSQVGALESGGLSGKEAAAMIRQLLAEATGLRALGVGVDLPSMSDMAVAAMAGGHLTVGYHAAGGIFTRARLGVLGEAGPEGVIPLAGAGAQIVGRALARAMVPELGALMRSPSLAAVGAPSPATAGGIHHHSWHLNQGDTIASAEHFASVLERRLGALGEGWK